MKIKEIIIIIMLISSSLVFSKEMKVIVMQMENAPIYIEGDRSNGIVKKGIVIDLLSEFKKEYPKYEFVFIGLPQKGETLYLNISRMDVIIPNPFQKEGKFPNFSWSESFGKSKIEWKFQINEKEKEFKKELDGFILQSKKDGLLEKITNKYK